MTQSLARQTFSAIALACLAMAFTAGCPGQPPTGPATAQSADAAITGSGKIRGVVTASGIDYTVAQAGDKAVAGADVYLDNLPSIRVKSNVDGSFELSGVPVGEHFIVAEKQTPQGPLKLRSKATLSSPEQIADLKSLVMRRTGSVTGVVTLEGKAEGLLGTDVFVAGSTLISKAKENGVFALINVAEGTYRVTASRGGYEPMTMDVTVTAGRASTLDLDLKKADPAARVATLAGQVVGRGDRPLAGANVSLRGPSTISTITDEGGNFMVANVPDGEYVLQIFSQGFKLRALKQTVTVVPADEKTKNLSLGKLLLESEGAEEPQGTAPGAGMPASTAPANPTTGGAGGSAGSTDSTSQGAVGQQDAGIPGTRDQEVAFPAGSFAAVDVGVMTVGTELLSVQVAQGFKPSKNGKLTALSVSVNSGAQPSGVDTKLFFYKADEAGNPSGNALASGVIAGAKIQKFGLGTPWNTVVFPEPIAVQAGQRYLVMLACDAGSVKWLLSTRGTADGEALIGFANPGVAAYTWDKVPEDPAAPGNRYAVFRAYLAE